MKLRGLIDNQPTNGERLPSEPDLARMLSASRATVRQALAKLEGDGILVRRHGIGTFVNPIVQNIRTRLEEVWDFDEMIRSAGHESEVRNVSVTLASASATILEKLALTSGQEVLSTENIFLASGKPVIYCIDYLPADSINNAYLPEELHGPVYRFLEHRCQQAVDYNIAEVHPVIANEHIAGMLDCSPGIALHYFAEVGYSASNEPVLYSEEYYHPEFFNFKVVRKMMTSQRR
jgi:GntR family transcriptional regulator